MSIKRKVWNTSTIPSSRETGFWISLLPKSGKIVLCQELVSKLKLSHGLRVNFIQDEDRPADWYIEPTKNKEGILFKVDLANKKRNLYCAQKKALVLTILESLSLDQQSYRIRVSREEEEGLLPIITKSAKSLNR